LRLKSTRRRPAAAVAVAIMLLGFAIVAFGGVTALPPPSAMPFPISQYGVAVVSANETTLGGGGSLTIWISSDQAAPFFLDRLNIFLRPAAEGDLVLDSMSIDGTGTITFSSYGMPTPKSVVVAAGATVGEVLSSLPSYVDSILVKEPMGNNAIVSGGGSGNGMTFVLHFSTSSFSVTVWAEAVVTAPTNAMIIIGMA
jgi:hypothetical protein